MRRDPGISGPGDRAKARQLSIAPRGERMPADGRDAKHRISAASHGAVCLYQMHRAIEFFFAKLRESFVRSLRRAILDSLTTERTPPRDVPLTESALAVVENDRAIFHC